VGNRRAHTEDEEETLQFIYTRDKIYKYLKGKGKAIPLQTLTGPEGSRRLRLPDFKTIGT
jgi:hypothetical protein